YALVHGGWRCMRSTAASRHDFCSCMCRDQNAAETLTKWPSNTNHAMSAPSAAPGSASNRLSISIEVTTGTASKPSARNVTISRRRDLQVIETNEIEESTDLIALDLK